MFYAEDWNKNKIHDMQNVKCIQEKAFFAGARNVHIALTEELHKPAV